MRMSRGIFTSVMMNEPLATVPRWYLTSLRTEDRIGVTGSRFLSLEQKVMFCPVLRDLLCAASAHSPGEVVSNHSSSHCHLLARQDKLSDPHQTNGMVPGQVPQRPRQSELC